jgi:UDP-N-acetylglucosamine 2-epimerase (non-hydrolysing)
MKMSDIFFEELQIPRPDYNLDVGSGSHAKQTGDILSRVEKVLLNEKPDLVIVYGDTNTTLAGALATSKLHIRVAHVEAGLRSFDRTMPEELNRIVTDHISDLLFCPTETSVFNLANEGITKGVHLVGDVMVDALEFNKEIAEKRSQILERLGITPNKYLVLTVHRPANTDSKEHMENIIGAVGEAGMQAVFPVHPRTHKCLEDYRIGKRLPTNIIITEPLGYLDMLKLMRHAHRILTDSGGIQKEAYLLGVPCITLRENTEWVETLEEGWNVLVGADHDKIVNTINYFNTTNDLGDIFGRCAAKKIADVICN